MNYDTSDNPAEHDCAWFEEEVQRLRARIRDLEAALRETHDALERLDAIYASEHDPDPVLGTVLRPAWLADALRYARTLLTPTAPDGGECAPTCRTITQQVNSDWCHRCRQRMRRYAEGINEPFCACGRRISECDGSRVGCGKRPTPTQKGAKE